MNLNDLNEGSPQGKPWLAPVCASLTAGTSSLGTAQCSSLVAGGVVTASSLASISTWKFFGGVPLLPGALDVPVPVSSFIGGYALAGAAATGRLVAPTSAAIDAYIPSATAGAVFQFTIVNASTLAPAAGPRLLCPDGVTMLSIPIGAALRPASTVFIFQRQPGVGGWTCLNGL